MAYGNAFSLVRYEQNHDINKIFICRECRTHLALHQELLHRNFPEKHYGLFSKMVNISLPEYDYEAAKSGAAVSCIRCNTILGLKYDSKQINYSSPRTQRFKIDMRKLLFCRNGNQIICADTEEPVESTDIKKSV